jgi:hypothetical protein
MAPRSRLLPVSQAPWSPVLERRFQMRMQKREQRDDPVRLAVSAHLR